MMAEIVLFRKKTWQKFVAPLILLSMSWHIINAQSRTFLLDLGNPATPTSGNWNNVTGVQTTGLTISNLIDSEGEASNISFNIVDQAQDDFGTGYNTQGYNGVVLGYPATACSDSYFAHSTGGIYELSGLQTTLRYTVKIFGSRMAPSGARVGSYTINGITQTLDAQNNTTNFIAFEDLQPDVSGTLTLGFNVASGSTFGYINVLEVVESAETLIAAPDMLSASAVTADEVTLTWADNSTEETGFEIERSTTSGSGYVLVHTTSANETAYVDTGLEPGTTYYYRVRAVNASGHSDYTPELSVNTLEVAASRTFLLDLGNPATPTSGNWNNVTGVQTTGLTISNLIDSEGEASNISFNIVDQAQDDFGTGYNTQGYNGVALGYPATACSDSYFAHSTGGVYELSGLQTTLRYTVKIFGSRMAPSGARVGSYTINGITQTLDAQNNTTNFIAFEDLQPDVSGTLTLDFNVASGSTFGYVNVLELVESADASIAAPSMLALTDLDESMVALSWQDNSTNESAFSIERSTNAITGFNEVGTTAINTTSFRDTGLTSNTTYFYRVRALGNGTPSEYSEVFEVTTTQIVAASTDLTHHSRYNGAISAIKWKNFGDDQQKLFTYHYDHANRLTAAQFAQGQTNAANVWTTSLAGGYSVPNISYDANGNITALKRQDDQDGARTIDALTYAYTGNQLIAVTDPTRWNGFADKNTTGNDYDYDDNGNLIRDDNQGITSIIYNHLDVPERVNKATGEYILYTYDATGAKLSEELYSATDELVKRTDYMGEFVFEDGELKLIHHEEGRIVPDETDGTFAYHYDLRDHLGNSRVTVSSKPQTLVFMLNYENDQDLPDDIALFEGTDPIVSSEFMDHTDQQEGTQAQNLYSHSQLLNAGEGNRIGSVIALPVMQGDQVTAEVFAKYINPTSPTNVGTVTALGTSLIAAFTGGGSLTTEMGNSITNNFTGTNGSLIGTTGFDYEDAAAPKAFLNVMFLPEDEVVALDATSFAFDQIAASAEQPQGAGATNAPFDHLLVEDFEAPAKGYVIIYLSNESDTHIDVHFDDLEITLNQMELVQSQDYYPYGLSFNTFSRVGLDKNEYLYQGKEEMEGTDWTDFHARNYHAGLGRFMSVDPLYNGPTYPLGPL